MFMLGDMSLILSIRNELRKKIQAEGPADKGVYKKADAGYKPIPVTSTVTSLAYAKRP
jgi:hypothetical protein